MIVDCAVYRDGVRLLQCAGLESCLHELSVGRGFLWIGLFEPTADEFANVTSRLGLHPLAVEDAVHAHQRPKLEQYGDVTFLVLKPARYVDHHEVVEIGQIMIFVGKDFVVTVRHGAASSLGDARAALERDPDTLTRGPEAVVHAVTDRVVDEFAVVLRGIGEDVDQIEHAVFSGPRSTHAERIFKLKREVLEFRWAVDPLVGPLEELATTGVAGSDESVRPLFS